MNRETFDWQLTFEASLIPLEIDGAWVDSTIADVIECLNLNALPDIGVSAINKGKIAMFVRIMNKD